MTKSSLLVFVALTTLASCDLIDMKHEKGNGTVQTENRSEKNFKGVESHGSFDVYVTTDSVYSVKIEAEENLLRYVETEIDNGNLKISTAHGISLHPTKPMKVYVSAPVFNKLSTSGSGNISGSNQIVSDDDLKINISGSGDIKADVKAPSVSSDISGSGDIELSGQTGSFKTSIAGNGDIKAGGLQSEVTSINIAGSGDALVNATKKLDVHIAGSGDVRYSGNPEISQSVAGSGSIQKVN